MCVRLLDACFVDGMYYVQLFSNCSGPAYLPGSHVPSDAHATLQMQVLLLTCVLAGALITNTTHQWCILN